MKNNPKREVINVSKVRDIHSLSLLMVSTECSPWKKFAKKGGGEGKMLMTSSWKMIENIPMESMKKSAAIKGSDNNERTICEPQRF